MDKICPKCAGELFEDIYNNLHCRNCESILWDSINHKDMIHMAEQINIIDQIPVRILKIEELITK